MAIFQQDGNKGSKPEDCDAPIVRPRVARLPEIDGVRGTACLMILLYHTAQISNLTRLGRWISPLTSGVDIFIVLSGFCLFLPVVSNPEKFSTRRFWKQRALRIIPAYYASILFAILLPEILVAFWRASGRPASWQAMPSVQQLLTHLSFTHMFSTETWAGINGSYWSLSLEAQFYVVMPLIVLAYKRLGVTGLLIPVSVSLIWNICTQVTFADYTGVTPVKFLWESNVFGRWLEFTVGAGVAWLVYACHEGRLGLARRTRNCAIIVGGLGVLTDLYALGLAHPFSFLLLPLSVGLILIGMSCTDAEHIPTRFTMVFRWGPLMRLGTISYSFYLLHQPTEWYFSQLLGRLGVEGLALWVAQLTLGAAIVACLATISYALFERPYFSAGKRIRGVGRGALERRARMIG